MMNVVNGGVHADNPIDIQEFMIVPVGAPSVAEAVRWGAEVFHALQSGAQGQPATTPMSATRAASRPISNPPTRRWASSCARSRPPATGRASRWRWRSTRPRASSSRTGKYGSRRRQDARCRRDGRSIYEDLASRYPILSIEDGMAEDDWAGWAELTKRARRQDPARRRRHLRHQPQAPRRGHQAGRRPTPSWSRSTRSAR